MIRVKDNEGGFMMKRFSILFIVLFSFTLFLSACGNNNEDADPTVESGEAPEDTEEDSVQVEATLKNSEGDNVGTAVLEETGEGVNIQYDITHLPEGEHGFHIHETGSCEEPDFESAGDHFNPNDHDHGFDTEDGPHAGDLANIEVDKDGEAKGEIVADMVTLETGEDNSLLEEDGTSLVIHADPDDNKSQPSGDAGDRIACGVIGE